MNPAIHEIALLDLQPGAAAGAPAALERWLGAPGGRYATLLACWVSHIGPRDRVLLWRRFESEDAFDEACWRSAREPDAFGVGDALVAMDRSAFRRVPFAQEPQRSAGTALFELRDYRMKPAGLGPILDLWRPILPARLALAPWVTALYALSGKAPRLLHIYPWESIEQRGAIRDAAAAIGWPHPDAPAHILRQESTLYRPTEFSPLQ